MMQNLIRFGTLCGVFLLQCATAPASSLLSEDFDNVSTLTGSGWVLTNNSNPLGTTGWFQGNRGIFFANSGAADSYVAANFLNAANGGNISNWLITPQLSLVDQVLVTFYTRTEAGAPGADRLELRLSLNGSSANAGNTDTSVGDFTTLLLTVNKTLSVSGYPQTWSRMAALVTLPAPSSGRFAFRYTVPDTSVNGDYIGIDNVRVGELPEPSTLVLGAIGGIAALVRRFGRARG
jgi:hypothetical protein